MKTFHLREITAENRRRGMILPSLPPAMQLNSQASSVADLAFSSAYLMHGGHYEARRQPSASAVVKKQCKEIENVSKADEEEIT